MNLSIRKATAPDATAVASFARKAFHDTFAPYNTAEDMEQFMRESFSMQQLEAEVIDVANYFLLAFVNDQLAGHVKLCESANPPELGNANAIEISRLYASIEFIGKGVGAALMNASIDYARKKQKSVIWLGVWEHNLRAIAFYTRFGFEKFSEHPFVLGSDVQTDWLMQKRV